MNLRGWLAILATIAAVTTGCANLGQEPDGPNGGSNLDFGGATIQALSVEDAQTVTVTVTGANISPPIVVNLVKAGGAWGGIIGNIPAGQDRLFEAAAYDASSNLIYSGSATVDITADTSVNLMLMLLEVGGATVVGNAPPVIHYITMSANQIGPNKSIDLEVSASDSDGSIAAYTWSATAGGFSDAASPSTVYNAPSFTGMQTITITVEDNEGATNAIELGVDVQTFYDTGSAAIDLQFLNLPVIQGITANPGQLTQSNPSTNLTVNVVGDPADFTYSWTRLGGTGCGGSFGDADSDTINGNEHTAIYNASGGAVNSVGVCTFVVDVTEIATGGTSSQSVTIARGPDPLDLAPVIDVMYQTSAQAADGEVLTFQVQAHDPEGNPLSYVWSASDGSFGAPIDLEDGGVKIGEQIEWTAPSCAAGALTIEVTAIDSPLGLQTTVGFISVTMPAHPCSLEVEPLYSINGANWNDHIGNDGSTLLNASDANCPATAPQRATDCLHGGEIRTMPIPGVADCSGVTISDTLGAFDWLCDDSGATVRAVSTNLKKGKRLADLIDFIGAAFLYNSIEIEVGGSPYLTGPSEIWWDNPVELINPGTVFNTPYTIYIADQNPARSIDLAASPNGGLVIQPGVVHTGDGVASTPVVSHGEWIEGDFDGLGISQTCLDDTGYRVRQVSITGCPSEGISVDENFTQIEDLYVENAYQGVVISFALGTLLKDAQITGGNDGIVLSSSHRSILDNVQIANLTGTVTYGMFINSDDVIINNLRVSNVDRIASIRGNRLVMTGTYGNHISGDGLGFANIASDTGSDGVVLNTSLYAVYNESVQILYTNNSIFDGLLSMQNNRALYVTDGTFANTFADLAILNNKFGVRLSNAGTGHFTGALKMGGNYSSECDVTSSPNGGLANTTCAPTGTSDAVLETGLSGASSLVGEVSDTTNPDGATGQAIYADIDDWFSFDTPSRAWGKLIGSYPGSPTGWGECASGQTCQVWDLALNAADTVVRQVRSQPTNGDAANTRSHTFTTGSVDYLIHSQELMFDGVGNDNGLCESNEACLYAPNFGAYQGHGALQSLGTINGTVVDNVTLYQYSLNGY